ncbi:trypsin-like serine peptidase [Streptomyces inhibens]|uniref:trypsin-like serine peptidase n=1 Tax=Streptomyces inhibens TaxID=2293571 RepID=UPI001EE75322|nr:serine protease [Streptomyces inhibens]UKY53925.1 serine protease [Streptomyces inhibens]
MSGSGAAPAYDGVPPADAARRLLVETSERGTTPAGGAAEAVGARAADECRGPGGPACTGRGRPGVPLRVTLALGALTVVVGSTVLALGSPSRDPFLAAGDTAAGSYLATRADGDQAAAAVLAGPYKERPAPPVTARPGGGRTAPLPASRPLIAAPAAPSPPIGALFSPGDDGDPTHHCTASVVHAPAGDLVVTAAHCVHDGGFRTRLVFAPGLHDGIAPYGLWVPTRIHVDPRWISDRDPDHDVAFLRVRRAGWADGRIEDITGAERIRFDAPAGRPALLTGYPVDRDSPVSCRHTADAQGPTQLRFPCPGFPNGTSGGPMLTDLDRATGTGSLIGVIGGLEEGGDDLTSYSCRFGADVAALYRRATSEPGPRPAQPGSRAAADGVRPRAAPRS